MDEWNHQKPNKLEKKLELVASRSWTIEYEGNTILIKNEIYSEQLFVNEVFITENDRSNFLTLLMPYQTLKGSFQNVNGNISTIIVKIGGIFNLNISVKVDGILIFKDRINIFKKSTMP